MAVLYWFEGIVTVWSFQGGGLGTVESSKCLTHNRPNIFNGVIDQRSIHLDDAFNEMYVRR
ncbi:hypothetical protein [Salipaludibacillus sp. CF4.18]|uniref:hypothetical protein n=1 Tax=Salipaludibacillus sp. CF4.18 TaxID=3373081 RepID=UPI003EE5E16A